MQLEKRLVSTRAAKRQLGGAAKLTYTLNNKIEVERQQLDNVIKQVSSLRAAIRDAMTRTLFAVNRDLVTAVEKIRLMAACFEIRLDIPTFPAFMVSSTRRWWRGQWHIQDRKIGERERERERANTELSLLSPLVFKH